MALTKADIVESTMDQFGFTKNQSSDVTEALIEIIKRTLTSGEDVLVTVINFKDQKKGVTYASTCSTYD